MKRWRCTRWRVPRLATWLSRASAAAALASRPSRIVLMRSEASPGALARWDVSPRRFFDGNVAEGRQPVLRAERALQLRALQKCNDEPEVRAF